MNTSVGAKKHKAVLRYGGADFFSADTVVLLTPKQRHYGDENSYYVLSATPEAYEKQVEAMAKATDPLAFIRFKEGDVFPRGFELFPLEKVNEMKEWRERDALSRARKALRAIGINPPRAAKKLKGRK